MSTKKPTAKEIAAAQDVLWRARETEKRKYYRFHRKEGVKYIRCQHLAEKTQEDEIHCQWIGDSLRVILCPICAHVRLGYFLNILNIEESFSDHIEEATIMGRYKTPIMSDWKQRLRDSFRRLVGKE